MAMALSTFAVVVGGFAVASVRARFLAFRLATFSGFLSSQSDCFSSIGMLVKVMLPEFDRDESSAIVLVVWCKWKSDEGVIASQLWQ